MQKGEMRMIEVFEEKTVPVPLNAEEDGSGAFLPIINAGEEQTRLAILRDYCLSLDGADKKIVDIICHAKWGDSK